jgi:hypothetical protein
MPLIRAQRLLNAIEAGTTNAAALQALLADGGRRAEFGALLGMRGQARRAVAGATTRDAIFGSALALDAFFSQDNAVNAILGNAVAKADFLANRVATVMGSTVAREQALSHQALLNAVAVSIPAMNAVAANASARAFVGVGTGTPTTAYNAFKSSHMCVAKMMAGLAGLAPTAYDTTRALFNLNLTGLNTLTATKDAVRFGLYSSIVGMLEKDGVSSSANDMAVDSEAPVTLTNNSNLYFLTLGWGINSTGVTISLGGSASSNTSIITLSSPDASMFGASSTTFAKILATAEASPNNNMRVGAVQGAVTVAASGSGSRQIGVIGIGTQA